MTASPAPQITYIRNKTSEKDQSRVQGTKGKRSLTHLLSDVRFGRQSRRDIGDVIWFDVYRGRKHIDWVLKLTQGTRVSKGDIRFAASKRSPSTPRERRTFVYAASRLRTYSVSVAKLARVWE